MRPTETATHCGLTSTSYSQVLWCHLNLTLGGTWPDSYTSLSLSPSLFLSVSFCVIILRCLAIIASILVSFNIYPSHTHARHAVFLFVFAIVWISQIQIRGCIFRRKSFRETFRATGSSSSSSETESSFAAHLRFYFQFKASFPLE